MVRVCVVCAVVCVCCVCCVCAACCVLCVVCCVLCVLAAAWVLVQAHVQVRFGFWCCCVRALSLSLSRNHTILPELPASLKVHFTDEEVSEMLVHFGMFGGLGSHHLGLGSHHLGLGSHHLGLGSHHLGLGSRWGHSEGSAEYEATLRLR